MLALLFGNNGFPSFAQGIHPAFDACTELLGYSHRGTLQFVVGLVDLTLDVSLLLEQFLEIFEVWTLCCFPVVNASVIVRLFLSRARRLTDLLRRPFLQHRPDGTVLRIHHSVLGEGVFRCYDGEP
jgi:hypothetical protein